MGLTMINTVGFRQMFQAHADLTGFVGWPLDAVGAQRIASAHHINQIPTGVILLPRMRIRVNEITIEQMTGDFVVKINRVIANNGGVRDIKFGGNFAGERRFIHALFQRMLRCDARDQHGLRVRQEIRRRLTVNCQGPSTWLKCKVGAQSSELRGAVYLWVCSPRFIVVPIKSFFCHIRRFKAYCGF